MKKERELLLNNALKWTATILGVVGGLIISLNNPIISKYAFILLLGSSVLWSVYGFRIKENSLIVLNVAFIAVNTFGLYNWIF